MSIFPGGIDGILWVMTPKVLSPSKSFFRKLYEGRNHNNSPTEASWKFKAPTKACFFAWTTTKGTIPTRAVLKRRNSTSLLSVLYVLMGGGGGPSFYSFLLGYGIVLYENIALICSNML